MGGPTAKRKKDVPAMEEVGKRKSIKPEDKKHAAQTPACDFFKPRSITQSKSKAVAIAEPEAGRLLQDNKPSREGEEEVRGREEEEEAAAPPSSAAAGTAPATEAPAQQHESAEGLQTSQEEPVAEPASAASTSDDEDGSEEDGEEGKKEVLLDGKELAHAMMRASKGEGQAPARRKGKGAAKAKGQGTAGVGDGLLALASKHMEYDARNAATWKPGEHVPFLFLASAFERISEESGRLAIIHILCNVFRTVIATSPQDLLAVVYLAANRVAPPHEGVELGIGDATIIKALAEATGRKEAQIRSEYKECGDLGLVSKTSRTTQRTIFAPQCLTCDKVLEAFRFIAKEEGSKSQDKKRARMKQLIVAARDDEPKFIVRLLQGKMRIGLAEQSVLAALAQAAVLQESPPVPSRDLAARLEEAVRVMKQVFSVLPVYDRIVPRLLTEGIRKLPEACHFELGIPVGPMLAKPTKGISEILDKFQDTVFTCEYKYDGERAQIHCAEDGTVEIYSRNAERNSQKYPDLVAGIRRHAKEQVKSFVLDAEVVAYDRSTDKILPFQILSTRARKGVIIGDIKVQVCLYAFDLLYLNGRPLLQEQFRQRRELLYDSFQEVKGEFQFATAITTRDTEEMQAFLNDAVGHGCEGAMVKTLEQDATYDPAKRSNNWLKLKKDYMDNLGDSLDLVPIGAFHGRGKRAGLYGAFLLACYDENAEEYQSICKIGTGFSEVMLEERSSTLREAVMPQPCSYYRFGETLGADVWFEPKEVWEVRAADLSISPVHRAANGIVDSTKGIALRFPRFLRVRTDKMPEQATTAEQVAEMYRAQSIHHQKPEADGAD